MGEYGSGNCCKAGGIAKGQDGHSNAQSVEGERWALYQEAALLVFPSNPNPGDQYLGWTWDGAKWTYVSGVAGVAGVASYNTRTGAVTSVLADVTTVTGTGITAQARLGLATVAATGAYADLSGQPDLAGYAPLAAPVFTGDARAVTPTYGDNDTSIATTAFVQAAVAPSANNAGRNLLHNGLFNVQQRGTGPWTTGYTADRWRIDAALDTASVNLQALSPAGLPADENAQTYLTANITGNAGGGAYSVISQYVENVTRLANRTLTLSFYAACTAGTLKIGASIDQSFGTGGSPSARVNGTGQSVTINTAWTRYSLTFTVPSISGKTLGTNSDHSTGLMLWLSSGATNAARAGSIGVQTGIFVLWGIQLEIGTQATPLDYGGSPQQQLAECQRFYQTGYASFFGGGYASNQIGAAVHLPVLMRAAPTVAFQSTGYANASGVNTGTIQAGAVEIRAIATTTAQAAFTTQFTASADL